MKVLTALSVAFVLGLTAPARAEPPPPTVAEQGPSAAQPPAQGEPAQADSAQAQEPSKPSSKGSVFSPYGSLSDEELAYEYQHTSLGGPVALTVVGGSVSILAVPTFLFSGIGALVCAANDIGDCTAIDTVAAVSGISTAVFGTMTVAGVIWLANVSHKKNELKREVWRRQAEGASLSLRLAPRPFGSMLILGGQF